MDIVTIGEVLIDLTQTGRDERGIPRGTILPHCGKMQGKEAAPAVPAQSKNGSHSIRRPDSTHSCCQTLLRRIGCFLSSAECFQPEILPEGHCEIDVGHRCAP